MIGLGRVRSLTFGLDVPDSQDMHTDLQADFVPMQHSLKPRVYSTPRDGTYIHQGPFYIILGVH